MWRALTAAALLALAGCGYTTATPIGSDQFAIECLDSVSYCAEKVNQVCPAGADVISTDAARASRTVMVVRCRR